MTHKTWSPERYRREAGFVSELGAPVLDWLAPRAGERILDLGCGDGVLTEKITARGATVVGIDASPEMAAAAGRRGLDARLLAAEQMAFDGEFDAVFSNAALHWMRDTDAVLARVYRALRPGGRFAGEMGGAGNVAILYDALAITLRRFEPGAPHPASTLYFPAPEPFRARLAAAGLEAERLEHFARPTPLPSGIIAWYETFAGEWLERIPPDARAAAFADLQERLRPQLYDPAQGWHADYVRLRFLARRPLSGQSR